ncbi:CHAT domain-containing protein [Flagellimonas sp. DF-77]|uniref:CHAT domain-containing protein n=1 Tax=Flagellimonas algarum TaxID=3230298 RepID=UPI0033975F7A
MISDMLKNLLVGALVCLYAHGVVAGEALVLEPCPELEQIQTLKMEGERLFDAGKVEDALEKYKSAIALYSENPCDDTSILFGIQTAISTCYSADYLNDQEQWALFLDSAKKHLDNPENQPATVVTYYVQNAYLDWYYGEQKDVLGFSKKAKEHFDQKRSQIFTELETDKALLLESNVRHWLVRSNLLVRNEEGIHRSYDEFSNFYNAHRNLDIIKDEYGLGNFYIGRYYQRSNPLKAIAYFDKAAAVSQDQNVILYALVCKGFSFLNAKAFDRVPAVVSKLESFEWVTPLQELNIHEIAARTYSETGNMEKLVYHTNKGLTLLNEKQVPMDVENFKPEDFAPIKEYTYPILLNQFALFLEETGIERLKKSADEINILGLRQFADRITVGLSGTRKAAYDNIKNSTLRYLIKNKSSYEKKKEILTGIEQVENQSSFNTLTSNRILAENKGTLDSLFTLELELRKQITDIRKTLQEEKASENPEIFELELQLDNINERIRNENPEVHNIIKTPFSFETLDLHENERIFKFAKAGDELFKIVISKNAIDVSNLLGYDSIANEVTEFLDGLKSRKEIDDLQKASQSLYQKLIGDEVLTASTIISSDGVLRYLPFELLVDNNGKYLVQQTATAYIYGLAHLNLKEEPTEKASRTVFFAPSYSAFQPSSQELAVRGEPYDLKGAQDEIKEINTFIKGTIYKGKDASRQTFLNLPKDYSVLHMAGHAFLNEQDAQLSNLVFSDDKEDNRLYISEIYGMKSNADLVVLSACNTGVGGYGSGESVTSLSQAFMYSGVPSTVSSLWSAPDQSTKEIMISFYEHLNKGATKSVALQKAKVAYLERTSNTRLKHPYYWSGFVLYGSDAPLSFAKPWYAKPWTWVVLGIVIVLIITYVLRRRKAAKK